VSQLQAELTPDQARHLEEHGEVLTLEAVQHIAKVVGKDSAAQNVLDEIEARRHDGIEPVVILDKTSNALVLLWGKT
jgi:hypothetical protein